MADNIRVGLELDDSKFKKSLNDAKQSVTGFGDTSTKSVGGVGAAFGKLGPQIAGALSIGAITSWVSAVSAMSEAIDDLAVATGMTQGQIIEFQRAIELAGGKASVAERVITSFFQKIDDAAAGSIDVQDDLMKLGVTMEDLRTLSERDIFKKVVSSLSAMPAGAERTALQVGILGRAMRGVDPERMAEEFDKLNGSFENLNPAIKAQADAAEALQMFWAKLKLATVEALQPINEAIIALSKMKGAIEFVGDALQAAAFALGAFAAIVGGPITAAVGAIVALGTGAKFVWDQVKGLTGSSTELAKETDKTTESAKKAAQGQDEVKRKVENATASLGELSRAYALQNKQQLEKIRLDTNMIKATEAVKEQLNAELELRKGYEQQVSAIDQRIQAAKTDLEKGALAEQKKRITESFNIQKDALKEALNDKAFAQFGKATDDWLKTVDPAIGAGAKLAEQVKFLDFALQNGKISQEEYNRMLREFTTEAALAIPAYDQWGNKMYTMTNAAKDFKDEVGRMGQGLTKTLRDGGSATDFFKDKLISAFDKIADSFLQNGINNLLGGIVGGPGGAGGMISGGGIGGGMGGGIASLFAGFFADGGSIPAGKFGIVGEKGPEVVTGPAQVYSNKDSFGNKGGLTVGKVENNFSVNMNNFDSMWKDAAARNVDFMTQMQRTHQQYRR